MKVICKNCGGLTDEMEAVKMSYADFICWQQQDAPFVGWFEDDHERYTQICQPCYSGNKKEEVV